MNYKEIDRNQICVIAGMPRAATTFLYHTFQNHPAIFLPSRKETEFFSVNYYRGLTWYLDFFKRISPRQVGFDMSPMYFLDHNSPERMYSFNPQIKVILIIRHPVDWIFSLYKHMKAKSYKKLDFDDFLYSFNYKKDGKKLKIEFQGGSIKKTIMHFRQIFNDNLLLCDFNFLRQNPLRLLNSIEKFVSIPKFYEVTNFKNIIVNPSDEEPAKIFNILMQNKIFTDLATKLIPKSIIISARYRLQASKPKNNNRKLTPKNNAKLIKQVEQLFSDDINYICELFSESRILLGTGKPFVNSKK